MQSYHSSVMATSGTAQYDLMYYLKGAAAGGICCSITHGALTPVDVVKTRVQLDPVKVGACYADPCVCSGSVAAARWHFRPEDFCQCNTQAIRMAVADLPGYLARNDTSRVGLFLRQCSKQE